MESLLYIHALRTGHLCADHLAETDARRSGVERVAAAERIASAKAARARIFAAQD